MADASRRLSLALMVVLVMGIISGQANHAKAADPLGIASVSANLTSAFIGDTITWTAHTSGGSGTKRYTFVLYKNGALQTYNDNAASSTFSYTPTMEGTYRVIAYVKDSSSSVSRSSEYLSVTQEKLTILSVTANHVSATVGDTITWTANALGGSGTKGYLFFLYKDDALLSYGDTGTDNTFSFAPTSEGSYKVHAYVGNALEKANLVSESIPVKPSGELQITSVTANKSSVTVGEPITWTAHTSGGSGTKGYLFFLYKDSTLQSYNDTSTSNTFTYTPTAEGAYKVHVHVGNAQQKASLVSADVSVSGVLDLSVTANRASAVLGDTITWTAGTSGNSGAVHYTFVLYKDGELLTYNDTLEANTFSYTPAKEGTYRVIAYAKDASRAVSCASEYVPVTQAHLTILSVTPSQVTAAVGQTITWTIETSGGSGTKLYAYFLYEGSTLLSFSGTTASNTFSFTPTVCDEYWLYVYVSDAFERVHLRSEELFVSIEGWLYLSSITSDKASAVVGDTITWTVTAAGGTGTKLYQYFVARDGYHFEATSDFITSNTYSYTPTKEGAYSLVVTVRDSKTSLLNKRSAEVPVVSAHIFKSTLPITKTLPPAALDRILAATPTAAPTLKPGKLILPKISKMIPLATPAPTLIPNLPIIVRP